MTLVLLWASIVTLVALPVAIVVAFRMMPRMYCDLLTGGLLLAKFLARCLLLPVLQLMKIFSKPVRLPPVRNKLLLSSGASLAEMIRTKQVTSEEVIQAFVDRVKEVNPVLNAVVEDRFSEALEEARSADRLVRSGKMEPGNIAQRLPLLGVPVTVKESIALKGMSNGAGQVRERGNNAADDSRVVRLLKEAGAVPLLVSNTPELCMNLQTDNKVTGRTNNPFDTRRTPGGSSGGEAALLCSAASVMGIASDIGGSIRVPAAFTGVFGHKPTPGLIPISGHNPTSEDKTWARVFTVGPMTRFAEDLPLMMGVIAGENAPLLRLHEPVDFKSLRIYFVEQEDSLLSDKINPHIKQAIKNILHHFQSQYNTEVKQLHVPGLDDVVQFALPIFFIDNVTGVFWNPADPKKNTSVIAELAKYVTGRSQISASLMIYGLVKSFLNTVPESAREMIAEKNSQLREYLKECLSTNAVLLRPTFSSGAMLHNEIYARIFNVHHTLAFNILEMPSTSCPMGLDDNGLPIGIQVVAGPSQDRLCLAFAQEIERVFGGWIQPPMAELTS